MSLQLRAGLAWATPVHPVALLNHLEAYMKALPGLRLLRLCWKFGRGKDVHITRLPVELEQKIEHLLIRAEDHIPGRHYVLSWSDRVSDFACFESTCYPSTHDDDMSPLIDIVHDRQPENCQGCRFEEEASDPGDENAFFDADKCLRACSTTTGACGPCRIELGTPACERTCRGIYEDLIDYVFRPCVKGYWTHWQRQKYWYKRIEQAKDDARTEEDAANRAWGISNKWNELKVGHSQILRKYFGLDIHFAHTTLDSCSGTWPKHRNYRFHDGEKKTTLCYLTLPKKLGLKSLHEKKGDLDPASVEAARAMRVDPASLVITEEKQRRFGRAMKALGLEVFLHGSQDFGSTISADVSAPMSAMADGQGPGQGEEWSQWPQLLLLVQGS
ncbi:hypothetical protein LTR10_009085 [Elasticomyces elasticus]|nr:hypothetical protein LTR10_009085 [Elasticomyces elasticus]KAK4964692.1 hypothetical protein LTR42_012635 [Elasticomyces elasticus]